ncbi:rod-binding protein [Alteriqipengyuania lutimaris]|uniref:Flagellar biosynthesis protein FlgJ n=1 Tax=Alteriqipengyuania lutimaris TaxID=1538146 RepID=A0A395LNH3_9SPHN|nr:rod-binding protein [Alteriqipengyuania lutimaris]MBB3032483.1 Rod binding domain-containing protein [Alteriqipengyuania lutimaris]RDS78381.1 flagellar biosynthesis protein FlgJ [Alteriqipengyuania lutimaris]
MTNALTAPLPSPTALPSAPDPSGASRTDIAKTAEEFEAVFLGEMSKLMLESVDLGDEFSGGHAEQIFRGILAEKLGGEIARTGGVGLAPAVMEQMIRMQEGSQ